MAVRLRGLPRQPHAVAPGEGGRGRGDARGDGRRGDDPVPDGARRHVERARPRQAAALDEQRIRLLDEHLNPLYLDAHRIDRDAVRELNAPNYYELYKRFGFRLDELAVECRALLDETERLWEDEGDTLFRARLGFGLDEARPWDVGRLFRAPELDEQYPSDRMLPALEATLSELGIDIRSQANVHLDLEVRPEQVAARVLRADRGARAR